jgi:hypothetical protein
MNDQDKYL